MRTANINDQQSAALTIEEAADYLRISRSSIYRLFRDKSLVPARIGKRTVVRRVDADKFLERCISA
jgi:excisionase family DNA binding protein